MLMDIDTVALLQRERYDEFKRQAAQDRLLRGQNKPSNTSRTPVATGQGQRSIMTALQQMVRTAFQTHLRAAPPR